MTKLLGIIVKSLDIDEEKIQMSPEEQQQYAQEQQQAQQMAMMQAQAGQKPGGSTPDSQSQIPQANATAPENMIPKAALALGAQG